MSKSNTFYKNLSKLRSRVKERRRQVLYDMINDENNKLEDKIALIKMSFKELESQELVNSFKDMIKTDDSKKE